LILLLIGYFTEQSFYFKIAIPVLIVNMIVPNLYYPVAVFWFGFSTLLGSVISKVVLTLLYFLFVMPVALLRRIAGKDTLQLKQFKKSTCSVMVTRDIVFQAKDIEHPY